jgi:outer membrane protein OmpA-like peptidoglycan-associated protein
MDVFVSQIDENGVCTKAQNIGKNINSEHDDFALIWNEDNKTGYFSSNRIDEKEFDHIFYFQEIDLIDTIKVIVRDFETNDLLTFVDVKALLEEGENDEIINIITDEDGAFELVLKKGFGYDIVCKKDGYESLNHKLSVGPKKDLELYLKPILKEPNKELPRPLNKEIPDNFTEVIYFELNSSYLNTENLNTLEKVVPILKEHPNWKIVVESHADIRAPENYNIWLSERRMLRVKNWLVNQGIDGNRISGAYYGETKPKIDCGSSCNEEEFRINRRTTIRVTDGQGI